MHFLLFEIHILRLVVSSVILLLKQGFSTGYSNSFYERNTDILLLWIQRFRIRFPLQEVFWILWMIVFWPFLFLKIIYYSQFIALSKKFLWNNLPTNCVLAVVEYICFVDMLFQWCSFDVYLMILGYLKYDILERNDLINC